MLAPGISGLQGQAAFLYIITAQWALAVAEAPVSTPAPATETGPAKTNEDFREHQSRFIPCLVTLKDPGDAGSVRSSASHTHPAFTAAVPILWLAVCADSGCCTHHPMKTLHLQPITPRTATLASWGSTKRPPPLHPPTHTLPLPRYSSSSSSSHNHRHSSPGTKRGKRPASLQCPGTRLHLLPAASLHPLIRQRPPPQLQNNEPGYSPMQLEPPIILPLTPRLALCVQALVL